MESGPPSSKRPSSQYVQGRPPPPYSPGRPSLTSGYPPSSGFPPSKFTNPSGMMHSGHTPSGYPSMGYPPTMTNQTRDTQVSRKRPEQVACCDQTYAKSKQGIFKVVLIILSFIAWICVACTPYVKRMFVIGGQTWPFHMVMFFTITANVALIIVYSLFVSGYHRRRKRKPWPTYELYFNAWLTVWFFIAAIIESCNAWRWNYGPYTNSYTNSNHMPGSDTRYDMGVGNNNQGWTHGWDMKRYCQMYKSDCHRRLDATLNYNGYYATHIFVCVALWAAVVLSLVATYLAYQLHCVYTDFINGVKPEKEASLKKGYVAAIKKKLNRPKPPSQKTMTSVNTVPKTKPPSSSKSSRDNQVVKDKSFQPKRTSTKTSRDSRKTTKSVNSSVQV